MNLGTLPPSPTDGRPAPSHPGTGGASHRLENEPPNRRVLAAIVHMAISVVAALALWAAFVPWEELTEADGDSLVMLRGLLIPAAVAGALRAFRVPWWAVLPAIAVTGTGFLVSTVAGSPLPTPQALEALADAFTADRTAVARYSVPVAAEAGSLAVLLTILALLLYIVLDLLLVDRGWMMTGGLILLVVHLVPANLGPQPTWSEFALASAFFVALLALVQARTLLRWDATTLPVSLPGDDQPGRSARFPSTLLTGTVATGALSIVAAGAITSVVPLPSTPLLDIGPGSAGQGSGGVTMANPLVDLRRDLTRGADIDLLTVSGGPKPTYLRTSVLTTYDGKQWSTGDRNAGRGQRADGTQSVPPGMSRDVFDASAQHTYQFSADPRFRSRWLPLPEPASAVSAEGDWRHDPITRDFVAWDDGLDTAGMTWSATALVPSYDAQELDAAPRALPAGGSLWTDLPRDFPQEVTDLAREVVGDASTSFQQAQALQAWFRSEFTYSLERVDAVGNDDLLAFLAPSGRTGYCEQFSASMALMARSLGIPARVAVGFLSPESRGDDWVFSAHDLHAWPELYFEGAGWVRFEPTPGSRSGGAPEYTRERLGEEPSTSSPTPSPRTSSPTPSSPTATPSPRPRAEDKETPAEGSEIPWTGLLIGLGVLAVAAAVPAPLLVRRRRREARLASAAAEQRWTELRDTSLDLGLAWPAGLSPRQSAELLGSHLDSAAKESLDRLVDDVERQRYSSGGQDVAPQASGNDVKQVLSALLAGRTRAERARAQWLPRSLFSRR